MKNTSTFKYGIYERYIPLIFFLVFTGCQNQSPPQDLSVQPSSPLAKLSPTDLTRPQNSTQKYPPIQVSNPEKNRELTWHYKNGPLGPLTVVVSIPHNAQTNNRMPVLIALHGLGEALKEPSVGARGWLDDYGMNRAFVRMSQLPLSAVDFNQMISKSRLQWFNQTLQSRPYRGIIVVTPYLSHRFGKKNLQKQIHQYGYFLTHTLLPRIYQETPALGTVSSTGIDGVSLGGKASILMGLHFSTHFGAVGGIQAAFGPKQVRSLATKVEKARKQNPKLLFHLLSSDKDVYREATEKLSSTLNELGQRHTLNVAQGNHSYQFNQGPGVYEMLLYYDRVLRSETTHSN